MSSVTRCAGGYGSVEPSATRARTGLRKSQAPIDRTTPQNAENASRAEHDDGFMAEHVASCERCRSEWNGALRIRALARKIASPSIDPAAARQVRERLLLALNGDRRRAGRKQIAAWGAFAVAAAAAIAV